MIDYGQVYILCLELCDFNPNKKQCNAIKLLINSYKQFINRNVNFNKKIKNMDKKEFYVASRVLDDYLRMTNRYNPINNKQLLKELIGIKDDTSLAPPNVIEESLEEKSIKRNEFDLNSFLQQTDIRSLTNKINPDALEGRAYFILDSRFAEFSNNNTKLTWQTSNTLIDQQNSTNYIRRIRDIHELRILSFVVQQFESPLKRAHIFIEEFLPQAFITNDAGKFHTVALLNDLSNPIPIENRSSIIPPWGFTPDQQFHNKYELLSGFRFNEGKYKFALPITTVPRTLSIQVRNPIDLVPFIKDQIQNVQLDPTSIYGPGANPPPLFGIDPPRDDPYFGSFILNLPEPHYINSDYIYSLNISNFSTDDPTDSDFTAWINTNEFTSIKITGPQQLTIFPRRVLPPGRSPSYVEFVNSAFIAENRPQGVPNPFTITLKTFRTIIQLELKYKIPSNG